MVLHQEPLSSALIFLRVWQTVSAAVCTIYGPFQNKCKTHDRTSSGLLNTAHNKKNLTEVILHVSQTIQSTVILKPSF